jgi:outer membrane protein assembly factor BamB
MTACADDERLYFGMRDGTVRALSLKDGKEVWRSGAFPKYRHYLVEAKGVAYCRGGLVFVRTEVYVAAFDCRTGRQRWVRQLEPMLTAGCVYGDRYYALQSRGAYWILDLKTGRDIFHANLRDDVPEKFWDRNDTFNPMVVSETHLFCGLGLGYFLAFERDTGRLVWHYYPKPHASFHPDSMFQIVNGRLYTGDLSFLRAFGPTAARKPLRSRKAAKTRRQTARRPRLRSHEIVR